LTKLASESDQLRSVLPSLPEKRCGMLEGRAGREHYWSHAVLYLGPFARWI